MQCEPGARSWLLQIERDPVIQHTYPQFGVRIHGMTLIEFLIAFSLSAVVLAATAQLFLSSKMAFAFNQGVAEVQQNGRFAMAILEQRIRMAGYQNRSVNAGAVRDAISGQRGGGGPDGLSDALSVRYASGSTPNISDCRGNPVTPNDLVTLTFSVSPQRELLCEEHSNRDGTIQREVLVEGIERMQIQFGEDIDNDGATNRYIAIDEISDPANVVAVRLCIEPNSQDSVDNRSHNYVACTGESANTSSGVLRRSFSTTIKLRNRM